MTKRHIISFRLYNETANELLRIYTHFMHTFTWSDEFEEMLAAHLADMWHRLDVLVRNMEKSAALQMSVAEALAFYKFWNMTDTSKWPLATVLIGDMIKKIDKRGKPGGLIE